MRRLGALVLGALVLGAALYLSPQKQAPKIVFENILKGSGISYVTENSATSNKHQVETMLAGVAVFDYNNDGLPDIYFVNGARLPEMDKSDPRYFQSPLS